MVTALIVLTSFVVFVVAAISPNKGTHIQRYASRLLKKVHRRVHGRSHLVKLSTYVPTAVAHWLVHKSAAGGKKTRWKLPF